MEPGRQESHPEHRLLVWLLACPARRVQPGLNQSVLDRSEQKGLQEQVRQRERKVMLHLVSGWEQDQETQRQTLEMTAPLTEE